MMADGSSRLLAPARRSLRARTLGGGLLACLVTGLLAAETVGWDFDATLQANGAPAGPATAEAAAPAFAPEVMFVDETIGGELATVASFSRGTYFRLPHGLSPNGGGRFVNRYTLILDVVFPEGTTGWQPLLQTDVSNGNDGDWFVEPDSRGAGIGISGNYGGTVTDGVWHRLALVVDLTLGTYTSYVNGEMVQQNSGLGLDGRFSLGPEILLFADENEENAAGFVDSVQLRDEALSGAEIAALGGPSAAGIPRLRPPPPEPVGLWEFDDPLNLGRATLGTDLTLSGRALANEGLIPGDGAARLGTGSHYRATHGLGPSGGGDLANRYTFVIDLRLPGLGRSFAIFQTSESNADDAELLVRPDGTAGATATGFSRVSLEPATWHRLVVVADNGAGRYEIYLDGERILDGASEGVDSRHALRPAVLFFADDDGEDGPLDVSRIAIHDRALFPGEVRTLGGPGATDPDNQPPEMVLEPAGPAEGKTQVELEFTFRATDADGDLVQFRIDWGDGAVEPWGPFQDPAEPFVVRHVFNRAGILDIRAQVRDEHGATVGFQRIQGIVLSGEVIVANFLTSPYLQNMKTTGMTIMWELDELTTAAFVAYGLDTSYGQRVRATVESSGSSTYIYRAVVSGLEAGSTYHYRVEVGETAGRDRQFRTAPDEPVSFSFGVWSDSQGTNHGAFPPDPLEPTKAMMAHMAAQGVDFAVTSGDLAENGALYRDTRDFYLDRVAKFLGQTTPWFNAWGNHDAGRGAVLRKFADMPSKDRPGFDAGWGSFSFDYAGCHFICIDYATQQQDVTGWLESDLQSDAARNARFTFLFIHVPPYCELWIDGSSFLRSRLVPLMEQYGVDACFSGHTHEYERGERNGIFYCITGGGSWLDFPERLVMDWPHMTVGGNHDLPLGIDKGLVNEYVKVDVEGDSFTCSMYAFDFDGSPIGVLDGFFRCRETTGEFEDRDGDGVPDPPEVPCADPGGGGERLPSDCNQDGEVDISDAVCLLGFLFNGIPGRLPCGEGEADDPGNIELLSANGDGEVNLSDAVYVLSYLFTGGPAPVLGEGCVRVEGCSPRCAP
ncbi:MAG: metallophosphoesterase [Planctomycetota bacterium]|nr:metallophosphoesterase [Planctomycetota bacterium]